MLNQRNPPPKLDSKPSNHRSKRPNPNPKSQIQNPLAKPNNMKPPNPKTPSISDLHHRSQGPSFLSPHSPCGRSRHLTPKNLQDQINRIRLHHQAPLSLALCPAVAGHTAASNRSQHLSNTNQADPSLFLSQT